MKEKQSHILLVEDEPNFGSVMRDYLEMNGFSVSLGRDGEEGLSLFREGRFQLCILDVMMPKMDGFTLAAEIRKIRKDVPLLFLTARAMQQDKLKGFKLGADDYITKPFNSEELLYRIHAILRRSAAESLSEANGFELNSYHFNVKLRSLRHGDKAEKLSPKESELLHMLCLKKNDLLSREEALTHIWGEDTYFNARSMDVFITRLRKRLKDEPGIRIENVHGKGYQLIVGT